MVSASGDREGEGEKREVNRNCGGVSYQTSQQFEFALVGAVHLDSNYGESIPSCRGDALGGDQGCIVCQKRSPINQVNLVTLATPPSSFSVPNTKFKYVFNVASHKLNIFGLNKASAA